MGHVARQGNLWYASYTYIILVIVVVVIDIVDDMVDAKAKWMTFFVSIARPR